jgi:hypothetical protein
MLWSRKSKPSPVKSAQLHCHTVGEETDPHAGHPVGDFHSVSPDFAEVAGQQFPPRCGNPEPTGDEAPCGEETELTPNMLDALASAWTRAAHGHEVTAKELAIAFRRSVEAHPELIGLPFRSDWIEAHYPILCAAFGVRWPPPFKDFAKELGAQMDRKRVDVRRKGKRETFTIYRIHEAAVVELPDEMRKRA